MRIHWRYALLSIPIGTALLVVLLALCYFATHQGFAPVEMAGVLLAFFLSLPIFFYCGADCNPPIPVLVANAVFDIFWLSVVTYLVLLARHVRNNQLNRDGNRPDDTEHAKGL